MPARTASAAPRRTLRDHDPRCPGFGRISATCPECGRIPDSRQPEHRIPRNAQAHVRRAWRGRRHSDDHGKKAIANITVP
jgi:hypothetical protein